MRLRQRPYLLTSALFLHTSSARSRHRPRRRRAHTLVSSDAAPLPYGSIIYVSSAVLLHVLGDAGGSNLQGDPRWCARMHPRCIADGGGPGRRRWMSGAAKGLKLQGILVASPMLRTGAVTRQTGRCCKAAPPTTKCKLQRGVGIDKKNCGERS
jgi:hypothetical protein